MCCKQLSSSITSIPQAKEKTELCTHFLSSGGKHCPHGTACNFAHGEAELRRLPQPAVANPQPLSALPPLPLLLPPLRTSQLLPPESAGDLRAIDPRSPSSHMEAPTGGGTASSDGSWSAGSGQSGSAFSLFSSRVSWVGGRGWVSGEDASSPAAPRWEQAPTSPTLLPPPGFGFLRTALPAAPRSPPEISPTEAAEFPSKAALRTPPPPEELNGIQSRLLSMRLAEQTPQQPEIDMDIMAARSAARAALQRPSPTASPPWW